MLSNKTFLKIISLVSAILLWAYVMGEIDPEKKAKVDVTVSFSNEDVLAEEGLAALVNDDMTTVATIKGKRSRVNDIKKSGLTAYVDVSSCSKGENKEEIVINVPNDISVEGIAEEYLQFQVEELAEETRTLDIAFMEEEEPVGSNTGGADETSDKVPWVIATDPDEVTVIGAQSAVSKVVSVRGNVSSKNLSEEENKWVHVSVIPVDKNGDKVSGVSVADSEYIRAQLGILTVKTVELEVLEENAEAGYEIDEVQCPDEIKIVGPADTVNDITKLEGAVDLKGITGTSVSETEMNLNLPYGIYLYDTENPLTVKVKLKAVQ